MPNVFNARYEILVSTDLGSDIWQLEGRVYDDSLLGYSAIDVQVGDLVFDESIWFGTTGRWAITEIISAIGVNLTCTVVWDDDGSPDINGPAACQGAICRPTPRYRLSEVPTQAFTKISENLQTRIRNIDSKYIIDNIQGGGSGYGSSGYSGRSGASGRSGYSGQYGYSGIIGLSGFSGESGISGYSGIIGLSGSPGFNGISGRSGYSGVFGISGYSGHFGIDGASGFSGRVGTSGISGHYGIDGTSGFSGQIGTSGISGFSGQIGTIGLSGYSGHYGISGFSGQIGTIGLSGYSGHYGISGFSGHFGIDGASGYSGEIGISGSSGYSGVNGQTASSGYSGISGFSGHFGVDGLSGYSGQEGFSGYSGLESLSGYSGLSGELGFSGSSGYSGIGGISGYSGQQGISGFSGIEGLSGYSGTSGFEGADGSSGYSGISGDKGFDGISGFSGQEGLSGYSGTEGISGFSGIKGIDGISGYSGLQADSGYSGLSGVEGNSGYSGFEGISGFSGHFGIDGSSGYSGLEGTDGISGYSGHFGIDGTSGYSGLEGTDGISGYSGIEGISGYSGHFGIDGSSGYSGHFGVDGTSGYSGLEGIEGISGYSGLEATSGYSGIEGISGYSGIEGLSGYSGIGGTSGYSGEQGISGYSGIHAPDIATLISTGDPTTGEWTDGIADITSSTSVTDSLYSLDELITAIAPAPAGLLTAQTLVLSGTTKYSAKLPSGLNSDWYKDGSVAGSTVTDYVIDNTFVVTTPDPTTRFKCGKASDPQGILSLKRDTISIDSYDLSLGMGSSTLITVNSIAAYNTIWSKANAYASITQSDEGHRGYTFSHPSAGESNSTSVRYDNVNTSPTFSSNPAVTEQTLVAKYLSGITHYGLNSIVRLNYTAAAGIFTKGYHPTTVSQITMNPTAIATNNQNPASTPAYGDTFVVSNLDLTLNVASRSSNSPYIRVALFKPNGATSYYDVSLARRVCTYGTVSTTTTDAFFDEAQRLELNTNTAWTSSAALTNGNAQVRNGTLQFANSTDYPGFSGDQEYQRWIYKTSASTGAAVLTGILYSDIEPYGTGDLNVLLQLDTDGQYFDLGRVVGSNNGNGNGTTRANSKGARSSGSGTTINWSIGTYTTANNDNRYRIIIIFRNTNHSMTAISSS